jgi:hypothetical protein
VILLLSTLSAALASGGPDLPDDLVFWRVEWSVATPEAPEGWRARDPGRAPHSRPHGWVRGVGAGLTTGALGALGTVGGYALGASMACDGCEFEGPVIYFATLAGMGVGFTAGPVVGGLLVDANPGYPMAGSAIGIVGGIWTLVKLSDSRPRRDLPLATSLVIVTASASVLAGVGAAIAPPIVRGAEQKGGTVQLSPALGPEDWGLVLTAAW